MTRATHYTLVSFNPVKISVLSCLNTLSQLFALYLRISLSCMI